jgi:hypothetical protein
VQPGRIIRKMEPYDASSTPAEPAAGADTPAAEPFERVEAAGSSAGENGQDTGTETTRPRTDERENMLPRRGRRRLGLERLLVRLIATCGIVGIGVALGAILASSKTQGWIIGLVVALVTVVLSAILWSSRQL